MQPKKLRVRWQKTSRGTTVSMRLLLFLSVYSFSIQSPAKSDSGQGAQVRGAAFILDSTGHSFIANAIVTLAGPAASMAKQTDERGEVEFRDGRPGTYTS